MLSRNNSRLCTSFPTLIKNHPHHIPWIFTKDRCLTVSFFLRPNSLLFHKPINNKRKQLFRTQWLKYLWPSAHLWTLARWHRWIRTCAETSNSERTYWHQLIHVLNLTRKVGFYSAFEKFQKNSPEKPYFHEGKTARLNVMEYLYVRSVSRIILAMLRS